MRTRLVSNLTRLALVPIILAAAAVPTLLSQSRSEQAPAKPSPLDKAPTERMPWTTSRITGSPEPPPSYRTERIYPHLKFVNPLDLAFAPGSERLFVVEQSGKLYSLPKDPDCRKPDLFIDLPREVRGLDKLPDCGGIEAAYALTFHPHFNENRYCYICYVLRSKKGNQVLPHGSRVSRFRVSRTDPLRCEPASEKVLIEWRAGGHNGCCLKFGPDGCLYISTGDAADPNPPDPLDTGQDISDLLSSILRIDVDHADGGRPYRVPADNPFVGDKKARPEVWAYGFRNPWRMSFDRATGELWVGDVGWEQWELAYRVRRGGNYGWSVMEGPQPIHPSGKRGPTPILPPTIAIAHPEAASITGGYVYRGKRFPELVGDYVYGDWETRRIWANRVEKIGIGERRLLALTDQRIVAFAEDREGELTILDYLGTLHRLVRNDSAQQNKAFPRKLSETGLFASVEKQTPAPGVLPFAINAEQWRNHATAQRWIALPGKQGITPPDKNELSFFYDRRVFPRDSVLANTIALEMERGNPKSLRRLETQVLHFDGKQWNGYTYRWNDAQTDAVLVDASGAEATFIVRDPQAPGGRREQTWRFPARAECATCHNPWAGFTLAFNLPQLDRGDQIRTLRRLGILPEPPSPEKGNPNEVKPPRPLVNPHDESADLQERARSYLHVNCAHCHRLGGGGSTMIDVRHELPLRETHLMGERPAQGSFGIPAAQVVCPGDPCRSVLYYRMAKLGPGRMPHLGSNVVDEAGLALIGRWIGRMPARNGNGPEEVRARRLRTEEKAAVSRLCEGGPGEGIDPLLNSTSGALDLLGAIAKVKVPAAIRERAIARATSQSREEVRDLFERFLPPEQRVKRLGPNIDRPALLALKGDAERGRRVFFESASGQCKNCHRVNGQGETLGPDLSHIGGKYNRAQLLENILEPSKTIEPAYVTYLAETKQGRQYLGILVKKTAKEVVLKDAQNKEIHLKASDVEQLTPQAKSSMPEDLLREMTARQAADLLEFLQSLK
jgi:putative heme-binding domain-containing protein